MSEVAKLRESIEQQLESARMALYASASIASHEAITARMARMHHRIQTLYDTGRGQEADALLLSDDLWDEQ